MEDRPGMPRAAGGFCFKTHDNCEEIPMTIKTRRSLSPQCALILNHLRKGHSITQRSALMDFGVMALPRRIADLKECGHNIVTVMEHNKLTGQRYARYSLKTQKRRA
jgi:hypothetical protein